MSDLHHHDTCPVCREGRIKRISRKTWMTYIPSSRYYRCGRCGSKFFQMAGPISVRLRSRQMQSSVDYGILGRHRKAVAAVLLGTALIGCIYLSYRFAVSQYESTGSQQPQ